MWFVCVSLPHACMHSQELGMLLMRLWMAPGGSPPRPGSGQDHWSFAQFVELLSSIELGTHFRCSQLDSGLRTIKDCQWCQCLCCLGTVYTLWLHEVGHCPAPGGTQAQFTSIRIKKMGLRISSWYLAKHTGISVTLQECASQGHRWPTAKPVMLDDVASSITSSMVSPAYFTLVTCTQCEPAFICKENRAPVAELPVLVVKYKLSCWCWALSAGPTIGRSALMPHSHCFIGNKHISSTLSPLGVTL